jgi:peptidoglycan/xylan/chitin deacetylase (PgdA/CDA1 family)
VTAPVLGRWRPAPFLSISAAAHVAGGAAVGLFPGQWPWIAGLIVADHLTIVGAGLWPRSRLLGPNLTRLPGASARRREIALTFDDGPDPAVTPGVLDRLDRYGAKATFFCVGRKVEAFPEIAAEIARRGHHVENHTYRHNNGFFFSGPATLSREIDRTQEAIEGVTGRRPALFRAPAGIRSPLLDRALGRRGLRLVSWTRRGFDTLVSDPERIARRLSTKLAPGDVILLHDGSAARGPGGSPVVLDVVDRLLDAVAARSLRPVVIPPSNETVAPSPGREE